jgi:hypothetical protein
MMMSDNDRKKLMDARLARFFKEMEARQEEKSKQKPEGGGYLVVWTPENIGQVLELLEKYLEKHPSGEHIAQSDAAHERGIALLCDIADIVEPKEI